VTIAWEHPHTRWGVRVRLQAPHQGLDRVVRNTPIQDGE
jgi:hypothetical protein